MSTEELLRLAEEVLAATSAPSDEFIEKIALYSAAFEIWQLQHAEVLKGKSKPSDEGQFRALAETHGKIMQYTEALKRQTRKDLSELRKKGKGIMAYTDILPKRISIAGTKKG